MLHINYELCVRCGLCAEDCFPGALTMTEEGPGLAAPDSCIGCGHCIAVCPRNALCDPDLPGDDIVSSRPDVPADVLLNLMRFRRSCRHYTDRPVTEPELQMLLSAARACPTAKNLQGTRYISVTGSTRDRLRSLAIETLGNLGESILSEGADPGDLRRAGNFIAWRDRHRREPDFDPLFFHAPLLLLFISDGQGSRDAAGAAAYTELMAAAMGMGCLYSGYFTACAGAPTIREALALAGQEQVVRCLVLGWPDICFRRSAPKKPAALTRLE